MSDKPDGGPAFPSVQPAELPADKCNWGMTLRDYFAGQALAGILAKPSSEGWLPVAAAACAFTIADAMLEARDK